MKKTLIMALTIMMLIAVFSPTPVSASERYSLSTTEAINLACEVFPEYEAEIKGEKLSNLLFCRNSNNLELGTFIIEETRQADSGEVITYQQDNQGIVVVTFTHGSSIVSSSYGTGYAYRKSALFMYCNVSDDFLRVDDFEYTLVYNGYDAISNFGTTSASTATVRSVDKNARENATEKAYARYHVFLTLNKGGLSGELEAYLQAKVGNDSFDLYATGE